MTPDRFWSRVVKSDGCWLFDGRPDKYGAVSINGRTVGAHVYSWTLANGPLEPGLRVLHHCDTPGCVRPDHLFTGTQGDNLRDACAKRRQNNARKTACKHGHAFTPENTRLSPQGKRHCRTCLRFHKVGTAFLASMGPNGGCGPQSLGDDQRTHPGSSVG